MTRVVASRYAVFIQAMCETPPRSPTIVGIAVETMVWSRAAMSMPASSAEKMMLIRRRVRTIGGADMSVGGACKRCLLGRAAVPRARGTGGADDVGRSGGGRDQAGGAGRPAARAAQAPST